jgi:O-antigen/teichoic acid export membrane protein
VGTVDPAPIIRAVFVLAFSSRVLRNLFRDELARGSTVNLAFAAAHAALGIFTAIVSARLLGPAGVGVVALGFMLLDLTAAFDNLPTAAFIREYAIEPTPGKVGLALVLKLGLGLLTTILVLALASALARLLGIPVVVPVAFSFIPTVAAIGSVAIASREARREMVARNTPGTVERAVDLALYAFVATAPLLTVSAVALYVWATVAGSLVGTLVGLAILPRPTFDSLAWPDVKRYLSFGLRTQTASMLDRVVFWIDVLLIDLFLADHAITGLYRTAYGIMAELPLAAATVTIALYPALSEHHGRNRRAEFELTLSLGFFYALAIAMPLAILAVLFPRGILILLFGRPFEGAAWMFRALAPVALLAVALVPFAVAFPAMDRPDLSLRLGFVEVAVNVLLDLALIPRFGPAGAIVATACAFGAALTFAVWAMRANGWPLPSFRHVKAVIAEPKHGT